MKTVSFTLLGLALLFFGSRASAQTIEAVDTTGLMKSKEQKSYPAATAFQCFPTTTTPAEYKGGTDALWSFMRKHLQYPPALLRAQVEGWTEVQFLVDSQGHISQLIVSHNLCQPWDEEVLRVVRLLNGKFEPATYNGRPVASLYRLRVPFSIK